MTFAACLPIILQSEGGYSNNPKDPGGPTNLGVTQRTLSNWLGHPATIADVQALTPETVAPIYHAWYWAPSGCAFCPAGVDLMVFDTAVNSGAGRAVKMLQTALGVMADGAVGPNTQAAAKTCDAVAVINKYAAEHEAYYRSLPTFATFGHGWLDRLARTQKTALGMVA